MDLHGYDSLDLIMRCTKLHHDLMSAGLVQTGHAMHVVVQKVGYEVADRLNAIATSPATDGKGERHDR